MSINPDFQYVGYSKRAEVTEEYLKGLSHEIDFKNFDKNLQNLT
jgi:hypothetical protein